MRPSSGQPARTLAVPPPVPLAGRAARGGAGIQAARHCFRADEYTRKGNHESREGSVLLFRLVKHQIRQECREERIHSDLGGDDREASADRG